MRKTLTGTLRVSALVAIVAAAAIVMASCYPNSPESAEEFDVVVTGYDQEADFTAYTTFAVPDSVVQVLIEGAENLPVNHTHDEEIIAEVVAQMTARGYTQETDPDNNKPDLVLLIEVAATTEYDPYSSQPWYSYWSWWWEDQDSLPDLDVTWGLDYSWYTGSVVYSYDVGALLIRMLDTKNLDPQTDDGARMLWLGTMNGILTGSSVAIEKRVLDGIIQMYEQSPYISKTGQ
jgi:hypothetical protein